MTRAESPLVSLLQSYPADEAVVAFITIPDHHHCHPYFYHLGHRNHQNMIIVIMKMIVMSQMVLSDLMNVAGTTHLTPCSCTTVQVLRRVLILILYDDDQDCYEKILACRVNNNFSDDESISSVGLKHNRRPNLGERIKRRQVRRGRWK